MSKRYHEDRFTRQIVSFNPSIIKYKIEKKLEDPLFGACYDYSYEISCSPEYLFLHRVSVCSVHDCYIENDDADSVSLPKDGMNPVVYSKGLARAHLLNAAYAERIASFIKGKPVSEAWSNVKNYAGKNPEAANPQFWMNIAREERKTARKLEVRPLTLKEAESLMAQAIYRVIFNEEVSFIDDMPIEISLDEIEP